MRVFVTGGSGTLGSALLPQLGNHEVVALVHRAEIAAPEVEVLRGDILEPRFGLGERRFAELSAGIDYVIHAAAGTDYLRGVEALVEANVGGTETVLELARRASAPVLYVGTAFARRLGQGAGEAATVLERGGEAYRSSKLDAEDLVLDGDVPGVIIRPSVIIGNSETGEIAQFQALHSLFGYLFGGDVPFIPLREDSRVDLVPQDWVAGAIVALMEAGVDAGRYWLTAGEQALTLREMLDVCTEFAARIGQPFPSPRFVDPTIVERLIRPVFMEEFPPRVRQRLERVFVLNSVLESPEPLPSSLHELEADLALPPLPEVRPALLRSLEYWAVKTGVANVAA